MSTSKVKVYELVRKGSSEGTKSRVLTLSQFNNTFTTTKKRARFRAGRTVRVRRNGVLHRYFGEANHRIAS